MKTTLATSNSIEGITQSIKKFYCNEPIFLHQDDNKKWKVINSSNNKTLTPYVILKAKKYIFGY